MSSLSILTLLVACDRDNLEYLPQVYEDYPGVVHIGALEVADPTSYDPSEMVHYDTIGAPEAGQYGGITATFNGTGGQVCVIVDPEAVFWNQSVATQNPREQYSYPDNYLDDGDLDLEVGLSAFYSGSPGTEMGKFEAVYEDSLGNQNTIEFNECAMYDLFGDLGAHSGRGSVEYCTIDTSTHPGKEYTIVLNTWSVPRDDGLLSYGLVVLDGECDEYNECFIPGEALIWDGEGGLTQSEDFLALETAFCNGEQNVYCEENPDQCGEL